ncbi:DoxX family protein [Hahella sp. CCB-MM4]|uniref:DoxX-like family protein n=1 Tax=Hahella sp. (strain CCB-MM4) TaxID=1926491 RepID=UPI000B9A7C8A|nr:DoxX-like family protein [Hahella sp. CCB-MM4]OZG73820.1 DoxX family protein [Hahella sp. CCB-MM4]
MDNRFLARLVVAFTFFYHGLIPKILFLSPVEVEMIQAHGLGIDAVTVAVTGGVLEIFLALLILIFRQHLWPIWVAMIMLLLLLVDVAIFTPHLLVGAFNPVTTNAAMIGLCMVVLGKANREKQNRGSKESRESR